jgi:RNA polymerase sigma-70 factor, ECF subfamily
VDRKQEQQLISAAQRGDEQAFGSLYDAYADKIYRYIAYRVNDNDTAQDLTSEVFLRVVEALPSYQDREIPFLAWLYRIAHARVIDHYRRSQRTGVTQNIDDVELSTEDDIDTDLMASYHQEQVRRALLTLTDEQQQVILFRFVEGYDLRQTSEILGKTVGAIKVMQHRAIQALNRALKQQGIMRNS